MNTYIHILPLNQHTSLVIFLTTIIRFFKRNSSQFNSKHVFFIELFNNSEVNRKAILNELNFDKGDIIFFKNKHQLILKALKYKNPKIYYHQLPSFQVRILTYIYSLFLNRIEYSWIIWGGDLYDQNYFELLGQSFTFVQTLKNKIRFFINKLFMSRLSFVCSVDDDYDIFYKLYPSSKAVFNRFYYPNENILSFNQSKLDKNKKILISHSASKENNHLKALDLLNSMNVQNVVIYSVLSYGGDDKYIDKVIEKGKCLFGERFIPIVKFMGIIQYREFLRNIDIAFFLTERQSSIFTSITMLSSGVKLIMNSSISPYKFYKNNGINVYEFTENIKGENFLYLNNKELAANSEKIKELYSDESILKVYKSLFT